MSRLERTGPPGAHHGRRAVRQESRGYRHAGVVGLVPDFWPDHARAAQGSRRAGAQGRTQKRSSAELGGDQRRSADSVADQQGPPAVGVSGSRGAEDRGRSGVHARRCQSRRSGWSRYWPAVYPLVDEDAVFRQNALNCFADPVAMIDGLRRAPLVSSRQHGRFSLRDLDIVAGQVTPGESEARPDEAQIHRGVRGDTDRRVEGAAGERHRSDHVARGD